MASADVLNVLYSKNKTAAEFNFDAMMIPSMFNYISPNHINELYKIATSLKLQGNIQAKYDRIDKVMLPLGFKRFATGTNRVVYSHLEDQRFLAKIALDRTGLQDNPSEYQHQWLLKPFVTKIFEVSHNGVIAFTERVQPINTIEEFASVAGDVFELLSKIIGKYVLEDIGSDYFMNWGLRNGFGPVLLDFPYLFELDGAKLYCNNEVDGFRCGGEVDYDDGINRLTCKKCGKRYLAKELGKKNNKSITIMKEEYEMAIGVTINQVKKDGSKVTLVDSLNNAKVTPVGKQILTEYCKNDEPINKGNSNEENPAPNINEKDMMKYLFRTNCMSMNPGYDRVGFSRHKRRELKNVNDYEAINNKIINKVLKQTDGFVEVRQLEKIDKQFNVPDDTEDTERELKELERQKAHERELRSKVGVEITINPTPMSEESLEEKMKELFNECSYQPKPQVEETPKEVVVEETAVQPKEEAVIEPEVITVEEEPPKKEMPQNLMVRLKEQMFEVLTYLMNEEVINNDHGGFYNDCDIIWDDLVLACESALTMFLLYNNDFVCDDIEECVDNLLVAFISESECEFAKKIKNYIHNVMHMTVQDYADVSCRNTTPDENENREEE